MAPLATKAHYNRGFKHPRSPERSITALGLDFPAGFGFVWACNQNETKSTDNTSSGPLYIPDCLPDPLSEVLRGTSESRPLPLVSELLGNLALNNTTVAPLWQELPEH